MATEVTPAAFVKVTEVSEEEFLVEEVEPEDEGGVPDADGVVPFSFEIEHVTFTGWINANNPPRAKVTVKILKFFKIFSKEFKIPKQGVKISLGNGVFGYKGSLRFYLADKAFKCDYALHGHGINIAKNGVVLKHL